jgi:hypothetical protein
VACGVRDKDYKNGITESVPQEDTRDERG